VSFNLYITAAAKQKTNLLFKGTVQFCFLISHTESIVFAK